MTVQRLHIVATRVVARVAVVELPVVAGAVAFSVASERFLPLATVVALVFWVIRLFTILLRTVGVVLRMKGQ